MLEIITAGRWVLEITYMYMYHGIPVCLDLKYPYGQIPTNNWAYICTYTVGFYM